MVLIVTVVFNIVSLNRVSLIGLLSMCSIVCLLLIAIIAVHYGGVLLDLVSIAIFDFRCWWC